ncbi:MAG: Asp-tRNA(Asn)/Glu-tRNA(Gln) amidotransferase subunit GatB [Candidatus Eisenbacteria bacterium]|nr:Asp-tRNA(Asn)/Glu-tRNA(Gln) amidotransferase subunit GatB [Candidatus Eisenbacteria bacterium]
MISPDAARKRDGADGMEVVIGLELHAQLRTRTKLFCACRAEFGARPNRHLCPICLGLPGALPVVNRRAVALGVRAALALGAQVRPRSAWARKHYFYPDLPKGYQITQYEEPLAVGGVVDLPRVEGSERVELERLHLEEDAGRLLHSTRASASSEAVGSRVDFNRCGVPLIEIVTRPDLRSAPAAGSCMRRVKQILEHAGVSAGRLEQGGLRCDANVSLRRRGRTVPAVRSEIKNLNSYRHLVRALEAETRRQRAMMRRGARLVSATLLWDERAGAVRMMRSKEEMADYRYLPEPDLPPLRLPPDWVARIGADLGETPDARRARWEQELGVRRADAERLSADLALADYFDALVRCGADPQRGADFLLSELLAWRGRGEEGGFPLAPDAVAELLRLQRERSVSARLTKQVLAEMVRTGTRAERLLARSRWQPIRDPKQVRAWVVDVFRAHPRLVAELAAGRDALLRFFVGEVMKRSAGRADPQRVRELLAQELRQWASADREGER